MGGDGGDGGARATLVKLAVGKKRCKGMPLGGWGALGAVDEGTCKAKCLADPECKGLVYSPDNKACSKFKSCTKMQRANKKFVVYKKQVKEANAALLSTERTFLQRAVSLLQIGIRLEGKADHAANEF